MTHLLVDPFRLPFMQRALLESVVLGALGGAVGVHVVLRRLAFISDALQHTVFPGIAIAFVLEGSLLLGALVAAGVSVALLAVLARRAHVDEDAALALLITAFFGLGVVVVSGRPDFQSDLSALLFGRILTVDGRQVVETVIIAAMCGLVVGVLHKELVLRAFDPVEAESLGYPVGRLDLALELVVALVVVAAVRAMGTVLVVAFVVTPAAAARLLCRRVEAMIVVAAAIGALCGWLGLAASFEASVHHGVRLAAGATVVLVMTVVFVLVAAGVGLRAILRRQIASRT